MNWKVISGLDDLREVCIASAKKQVVKALTLAGQVIEISAQEIGTAVATGRILAVAIEQ